MKTIENTYENGSKENFAAEKVAFKFLKTHINQNFNKIPVFRRPLLLSPWLVQSFQNVFDIWFSYEMSLCKEYHLSKVNISK